MVNRQSMCMADGYAWIKHNDCEEETLLMMSLVYVQVENGDCTIVVGKSRMLSGEELAWQSQTQAMIRNLKESELLSNGETHNNLPLSFVLGSLLIGNF